MRTAYSHDFLRNKPLTQHECCGRGLIGIKTGGLVLVKDL